MKRRREQLAMAHQSGEGAGYVSYRKVWLGDGGEAAKGGGVLAALPEKARLRILSFLPIKSAIRMGSISSERRELWKDVSVILKLDSPDSMRRSIQQLEKRGRRGRFLLFSVTIDYCTISTKEFNPFLEYAAACSAEAIHIENKKSRKLSFPLQQTSRRLVLLSLIGVKVAKPRGGNPTAVVFHSLEEIHIFSAEVQDHVFRFVVRACPLLRVLDLRSCSIISHIDVEQAGAHLMSLAVADCPEATVLRAGKLLGLRSFRYRGSFLSSFSLPANDSLTDLCIMFSIWGTDPLPSNNSFSNLPDLSNLTVLTICSISLRAMSLTATHNAKRNLRSLRELHLIMLQMEPINLGDIYAFLNNCRCPQLEKFFVQLPIQGCESLQNTVKGEPHEGFEKLAVVKTTNFKYDPIEIKLLQFLFNKANFLQRLILVCPQPVPEERRLQLQSPANVQLTVCADDSTLKSFHSDILPKKTK